MKKIKYSNYEEWLHLRRKGIGGSDAPAVCGLSPFSNPIKVWLEKTGKLPIEHQQNERLEIGRKIEDFIATLFSEKTGKKIRKNKYILQDEKYPFMLANIDREIVKEDAILEIKNTNSYKVKQVENEIPEHWQIQCQHYLAVVDKEKAYLAILAGNEKFIIHELHRDEEIIARIRAIEADFWQYVEKQEMPPVSEQQIEASVFEVIYPELQDNIVVLEEDAKQYIEKYLENQNKIKNIKMENESIKTHLLSLLKGNIMGVLKEYVLINKEVVKKEHVVKETKYRDFRIKIKKEGEIC